MRKTIDILNEKAPYILAMLSHNTLRFSNSNHNTIKSKHSNYFTD